MVSDDKESIVVASDTEKIPLKKERNNSLFKMLGIFVVTFFLFFVWVDDEPYVVCDNGEEIPPYYVNDGDNDCGDYSDERTEADSWEVNGVGDIWFLLFLLSFGFLIKQGISTYKLAVEVQKQSEDERERSVVSRDSSPVVKSHVFLVITVIGGMFGLDKAYKGDYAIAFLKLLTLGGLCICQLYDIYVAAGEAGRSWSLDSDYSLTTEKHVILITAIVGGHIGLDRAYKGDGVTGVFKLLTLGGLGIWWLVDVYVAAKEAGKSW